MPVPEGLEPRGGGDEHPLARQFVFTSAQRLTLPDAGDLAFGQALERRAVQAVERGDGLGAADAVGGDPDVPLELDERAGGVVTEDAVLAPGVEAERVQPALELADVVAPQHRPAAVEHAVAEAEAALDERGPRLPAADPVGRAARGRPGTPRPRRRCRCRTGPTSSGGTSKPSALRRCWRSRTASPLLPGRSTAGSLNRCTRRGPGGADPCPWRPRCA